MSLQGTFDTLPVTELFGLLASATKTGALRLESGDHEASVFLTGGRCCAVESGDAAGAAAGAAAGSDAELATRLVDVGFAFARLSAGSFRFSDSDLAEYDTGVTTPLEPAVVEIRSLLDQWREIEATIPSLDVRVRLAPVLREDEVVVTAREWSLLVALDGTPTVRELVARRNQPMMDVCRDLKGLVDRGALEIGAAVPDARTSVDTGTAASDALTPPEPRPAVPHRDLADATVSLLEPSAPYAPDAYAPDAYAPDVYAPDADDFVTAEDAATAAADADAVAAGIVSRMARSGVLSEVPANVAASAAEGAATTTDPDEAAPDRGALLRLFSALKEN